MNFSNELGAPPDPDHEVIAGEPAFPEGVRILQTAAAGAVSAALGDDGNVYAWGRPWGQSLGTASTQGSWIPSRVLLPPDANPVAVAVSESYTLLLTADGRVFGVGNLAGRYPTMEETRPRQLSFPEEVLIESISVSATHALAVTRTGELFGWGATRYGALGIADDAFQETPVRISLAGTPRVVAASAHGGFSAILTADDRLLVSGPVGQVGRTIASFTPDVGFREIALPSGVQPVQLPLHGYSHLLVMASDGQLYGWGDNDYGQLGLGDLSRRATPVRIPVPRITTSWSTPSALPVPSEWCPVQVWIQAGKREKVTTMFRCSVAATGGPTERMFPETCCSRFSAAKAPMRSPCMRREPPVA